MPKCRWSRFAATVVLLAVAVGSAAAGGVDDWLDAAKQPVEWLKWGADARLREVWGNNLTGLNKDAPNHESHFQRYRFRAWATVTPVKDIDLNARIVYEPRHICKPDSSDSWVFSEGIIDKLNVVWRKPAGLPVTFTLGRQDFIFGDGWLVLDGTPLDGSRTIFFDALRATVDFPDYETTVDVAYIDQKSQSDRYIEPFCDEDESLVEDDEQGVIVYVINNTIPNTRIDGYYIYKSENRNPRGDHGSYPLSWSWQSDIHTFGARVARQFNDKLKGRAELAGQLGDRNGRDLAALGFNSRLEYSLKDAINNSFRVDYEYASGDDDPDSGTDTQFDRVWGRWPQFSEIIIREYVLETRVADVTNFHRVGAGWSCNPTKKLEVIADYNLLFADKNTLQGSPGFADGCFRGQLFAAWLRYKITPRVSTHVMGEVFCPGTYYDDSRNDPAIFVRYEIQFTW